MSDISKTAYFLWSRSQNSVSSFAYFPETSEHWYRLLYIHEGSGQLCTGSKSIAPVQQDCVLLLNSAFPYWITTSEHPLLFTAFLINCESYPFRSVVVIPRAPDGMKRALYLMENHAMPSSPGIKSDIISLFFDELKNVVSTPVASTSREKLPGLMLKQILDTRYMEPLHLDQFAKELYMNKYYLIREFKKEFGIPPIEYLLNRRIEEACNLLRNTDRKVTEIGELVGMPNPTYFTQVFRKRKGTSPLAFRKSSRPTKAV